MDGYTRIPASTHIASGVVPGTRTRYDAGDLEVEVEWMQRDVSGGDERRTFRGWEATPTNAEAGLPADAGPVAGKTYTFNSTELRAVGLVLEPVPPMCLQLAVHRWELWLVRAAWRQQLVMLPGDDCPGSRKRCTRWFRHGCGSCGSSQLQTRI